MDASDLTQLDVYDLLGRYGGYLDARGRSIIDHFLEYMAHPAQRVAEVRDEEGLSKKLYYATLAMLAKLQTFAAGGAEECPAPPPPKPRRTRAQAARDAAVDRRAVTKAWHRILEEVKK